MYIENTYHFRGFKLKFPEFGLIDELTYDIDIGFQEKILTNDALDLTQSPTSRS
jgi:hypothetical protein